MTRNYASQEKEQRRGEEWEKRMLGQIAGLLAKEGWISPEEQIRFLSLVYKEE